MKESRNYRGWLPVCRQISVELNKPDSLGWRRLPQVCGKWNRTYLVSGIKHTVCKCVNANASRHTSSALMGRKQFMTIWDYRSIDLSIVEKYSGTTRLLEYISFLTCTTCVWLQDDCICFSLAVANSSSHPASQANTCTSTIPIKHPWTLWCVWHSLLLIFSPLCRWWLSGIGRTPGDVPLGPARASPALPDGARGGVHRQEQARQPVLQGHARHADLLQVQQRVGPSEGAHGGGARGRDLRLVAVRDWEGWMKQREKHTNMNEKVQH